MTIEEHNTIQFLAHKNKLDEMFENPMGWCKRIIRFSSLYFFQFWHVVSI